MTPAERDAAITALRDRALLPSFGTDPTKSPWWSTAANNWAAVCHGGLVAAALAVADREPTLAARVVARARRDLAPFQKCYAPDGAFAEGASYWAYATQYYIVLIECLRTATGDAGGLEHVPGFLATADYRHHHFGPSGLPFNFSDCWPKPAFEPTLHWFARELARPELSPTRSPTPDEHPDLLEGGDRFLPLALLWREPSTAPASPLPLTATYPEHELPQAFFRSAWGDPHARYFACKGGRANVSHGHLDAGSFVFEANGVRWAVDPGVQPYAHVRANGLTNDELFSMAPDSPRWRVFRIGAEAHNILRFNGASPRVDAPAPLRALPAEPGESRCAIDLSATYADQAQAVRRVIVFPLTAPVRIEDEWSTHNADGPTEVTWQWLTHAHVERSGDDLILSQSGHHLRLRPESDTPFHTHIEDVSAPREAFDSPNPGLVRITIKLLTPPASSGHLRVRLCPKFPEAWEQSSMRV